MESVNNACKLSTNAWRELQAFKTRQMNRREKLNRHKNLTQDLISGLTTNNLTLQEQLLSINNNNSNNSNSIHKNSLTSTTNNSTTDQSILNQPSSRNPSCNNLNHDQTSSSSTTSLIISDSNNTNLTNYASQQSHNDSLQIHTNNLYDNNDLLSEQQIDLELIECLLLLKLCDVALKLPIDSKSLQRSLLRIRGLEGTSQSLIENLLQKFAHQELISIEEPTNTILLNSKRTKQIINISNGITHNNEDDDYCIYVTSADHTKLVEFDKSFGSLDNIRALLVESKSNEDNNHDESDLSINNNQSNCSVPIQTIRISSNDSSILKDSDTKINLNGYSKSRGSDLVEGGQSKVILNEINLAKLNDSKRKYVGDDVESLLSLSSTRERENKKLGEELLELLSKPTAKERNLLERFRSADGYRVQEFCPKGTKGECKRNDAHGRVCDKLHFKKIIAKHTEESLGDCSFLNTCFHMDTCKYVHYEVDYDDKNQQNLFKKPHPAEPLCSNSFRQQQQQTTTDGRNTINGNISTVNMITAGPSSSNNMDSNNNRSLIAPKLSIINNSLKNDIDSSSLLLTLSPEEQARIDAKNRKRFKTVLYPPQWIQCDLRFFDMGLLGKFSVVMADPPWDIHMELPYGTMSDDEMRKLNIPALQDDGVIFLWVTGRAMELGRECLALWGYERCDEIIWVKTNQLQRIIRTGRTGHWLNHGKEHCLVGVKGNPKDINRGLDCDVIVAEVRATSHKPDEIYGIIERLSPGTRKIELFGRSHNVQPNWITLGNQLDGVRLVEPCLVNAFKKLNIPFQTLSDSEI